MKAVRLFALACAAGMASFAMAQQTVIDYKHRIISCDWLDKEYQAILERNKKLDEGMDAALIRARVFSRPFFIIVGDFVGDGSDLLPSPTDIRGSVNFSGDISDVASAARRKNCHNLFDKIFKAQENGELNGIVPAPVRSPIGTKSDN